MCIFFVLAPSALADALPAKLAPFNHGHRVRPSGRFPSDRLSPRDSMMAADGSVLYGESSDQHSDGKKIHECRICPCGPHDDIVQKAKQSKASNCHLNDLMRVAFKILYINSM
ncbi:hypothetical protein CAPTEDRAFT_185175 [Capitella teleta]|uniref:Uncharacterized protein n=1 Tax=Capitella teleta TaxID=283909 RepID=R7VF26_CAPTE|nr:hypothetical protein CAPTEDRAFT_185175 [Capitella teleta]|eukprot:ELU14270.1 hypothetical protein CAPTEDRAFT_185175 [Capitella teleta]